MAPKKAAKKTKPGKKHGPHKPGNDARRTFEHMGRVQALSPLTASESETITLLTNLAEAAYRARRHKESADLLRAAEHLSFATLHTGSTEVLTADLRLAVKEEFDHLVERMTEHASEHGAMKATGHRAAEPLQQLRLRFHREAKAALERGSYRAALELARGAEALAHVDGLATKGLPSPASRRELRN